MSGSARTSSAAAPVPRNLALARIPSLLPFGSKSVTTHARTHAESKAGEAERGGGGRKARSRHTHTHTRAWCRYKMPLFRGQCASTSATLVEWTS